MDDFMKTEAKDIISTAIEKASGATGINIEVSSPTHNNVLSSHFKMAKTRYSLLANS